MSKLTRLADQRAAQTETRAFHILAAAMFGAPKAREYDIDSKGRKVRKFSREFPCSTSDVRELLVNVRVVDEDEALEVIGKNTFQYMVKVGYLVKDARAPYFWVSKKCADAYDLPAYMGPTTFPL